MLTQTVRATGVIAHHDRIKGKGAAASKRFLENTLREFAKASRRNIVFYRFYTLGEKQISSFLTVVFSKFVSNVLVEFPTQREWSKIELNDSHGWVDFLCDFEGYRFVIEVKHEFMSSRTCTPTKSLISKWRTADNQLDCVDEFVSSHADVCTKGVIKLSLTVVVFYERTSEEMGVLRNKDKVISCNSEIISSLEPQPNWVGTWFMHPDLIEKSCIKNAGRRHSWPAVKLIAHAHELIKM